MENDDGLDQLAELVVQADDIARRLKAVVDAMVLELNIEFFDVESDAEH